MSTTILSDGTEHEVDPRNRPGSDGATTRSPQPDRLFAAHLGQTVTHQQDHDVWTFGDRPDVWASMLQSLNAPDFTLPDVEGNLRSLSDYRGTKVFLLAWAS